MSSGQIIQWHDVFAIIDDGAIPLPRYAAIELAIQRQARLFPSGVALLGILPPSSSPPPDDSQRAVTDLLTRNAAILSSLSYVVEGSGFKAVTARATLIAMKLFSERPYPIYVGTTLVEVLAQILPHLMVGKTVTTDVGAIARAIAEARAGSTSR